MTTVKKPSMIDATFGSIFGKRIEDELFLETREWIEEEASNMDLDFLYWKIDGEPAERHSCHDTNRSWEVYPESVWAELDQTVYKFDMTESPILPKHFAVTEVEATLNADEFRYWKIKGNVEFFFKEATWTKREKGPDGKTVYPKLIATYEAGTYDEHGSTIGAEVELCS